MEGYTELEIQRRHLLEQTTPEGRKMVMAGIDRLLDNVLDFSGAIPTQLPSSPEGQAHLDTHVDRGCE